MLQFERPAGHSARCMQGLRAGRQLARTGHTHCLPQLTVAHVGVPACSPCTSSSRSACCRSGQALSSHLKSILQAGNGASSGGQLWGQGWSMQRLSSTRRQVQPVAPAHEIGDEAPLHGAAHQAVQRDAQKPLVGPAAGGMGRRRPMSSSAERGTRTQGMSVAAPRRDSRGDAPHPHQVHGRVGCAGQRGAARLHPCL